jgi:O-succinylhomoserine sulfhydrylase
MTKHSRPWGYHESKDSKSQRSLHPQTLAVRAGLSRTGFGETSEALFLNSGFTYHSAAQAEASFASEEEHYLYSRFGNPTVGVFEERLAALEGAEAAFATATGMSAMFTSLACLLAAGDRVVASSSMFSSCYVVLTQILPRWGIEVELVAENSIDGWSKALSKPTKAVFLETPSNPLLEIIDIQMVTGLAKSAGALVIVDNVMASPVLQKPLEFGADVVMYSATKHIDGQGRVLGGAILGSRDYIENQVLPFARHTGPAISPFNAWVMLKSLETMNLRVSQMSDSALFIAQELSKHNEVAAVHYPFLSSHPGFDLAKKQMTGGGSTLAFELKGGKEAAFNLLDRLEVIDISNNLGDSKSLITHPASTTHASLGPEVQEKMGIGPNMLRLSVGLEHPDDLVQDLLLALEK